MSASSTISTLVWALIVIIVVIVVVVVLFKVLALLFVLPAYAQENGTGTIATFQGTEGKITSSLQFIPQQAYIQTVAPSNVPNSNSNSNSQSLTEVLIPLITGGGAFLAAKLNADKNHKSNAAEILKTKENTKELARVTYDMNPEAASKIDDAPSIKVQTLTEDVNKFADKIAKK